MNIKMQILLLTAILLVAPVTELFSVEKTKKYHETWPASEVKTLEVSNRFGEINVVNSNNNKVTIDVVVTVKANTENRAENILNEISVEIDKPGRVVMAKTQIGNNFNSKSSFSIDYTINIPPDKNLRIDNKYGNTFINKLHANGNFNIKYGNFNANELTASPDSKISISLGYGNSRVEIANTLYADIMYSDMTLGLIKELKLESKYSKFDIEDAYSLDLYSKYDKFRIEKANMVVASSKYSNLRIGELKKSIKVDNGYGGIKIDKVAADFESISITNSYGQISLGLNDTGYDVDAMCEYCGISYPEGNFSGSSFKDNNVRKLKGSVGDAGNRKIFLRSRYGSIHLNN